MNEQDKRMYRIWDSLIGQYDNEICVKQDGSLLDLVEDEYYFEIDNPDSRYHIERCSGLKDVNGQWIFENDRVQGVAPQIQSDYLIYIGTVVFKDSCFRVEYYHQGIGLSSALLSSWFGVPFNKITITGAIHDEVQS